MTQHYDNQLSQLGQSAHITKTCVCQSRQAVALKLTLPYQM